MNNIQYDQYGNARPRINFASSVARFDGNWDRELEALSKPHRKNNMSDWLITPPNNKPNNETVEKEKNVKHSTIEYYKNKRLYHLRRLLQWMGLGIPTKTLTIIPCNFTQMRKDIPENTIHIAYEQIEQITIIDEAAHYDPERFQLFIGMLIVWSLIAYAILSLTGVI